MPWPGEALASQKLATWPQFRDGAAVGRALDPELAGSALALLSLSRVEALDGGLGALGEDFVQAAESAGAEIRLGQEAVEVVIDAMHGQTEAVVRESADLLYNLVVLWVHAGVHPDDVWA